MEHLKRFGIAWDSWLPAEALHTLRYLRSMETQEGKKRWMKVKGAENLGIIYDGSSRNPQLSPLALLNLTHLPFLPFAPATPFYRLAAYPLMVVCIFAHVGPL